MEKEYIKGIPVDAITLSEIISSLPKIDHPGEKNIFLSINPQIVVHADKYPEILELIAQANYRIADGIGIVKVSQRQEKKIKERVAGFDLMLALLSYANDHQKRIFLYGAEPTVLENAVMNIKKEYPNLVIVGAIDGYTKLTDEEKVSQINDSQADMVFVALGFPRQELWLAKNYQQINARFFQDVGGSFDVISGKVKRAPNIFIKLNLEWLYRSLSSFKRLYRVAELPIFLIQSAKWYRSNRKKR